MGMVVLYSYKRYIQPFSIGGGHIVRVHVTGSRLGHYIKKLFKMLRLLPVVFQGLQVLQIPYVLTLENISTPGQAKAGLLFCPAGQYALQFSLDRQRIRHITAGASGKVLPPVQFPA